MNWNQQWNQQSTVNADYQKAQLASHGVQQAMPGSIQSGEPTMGQMLEFAANTLGTSLAIMDGIEARILGKPNQMAAQAEAPAPSYSLRDWLILVNTRAEVLQKMLSGLQERI
jgi:hypothetical protein